MLPGHHDVVGGGGGGGVFSPPPSPTRSPARSPSSAPAGISAGTILLALTTPRHHSGRLPACIPAPGRARRGTAGHKVSADARRARSTTSRDREEVLPPGRVESDSAPQGERPGPASAAMRRSGNRQAPPRERDQEEPPGTLWRGESSGWSSSPLPGLRDTSWMPQSPPSSVPRPRCGRVHHGGAYSVGGLYHLYFSPMASRSMRR